MKKVTDFEEDVQKGIILIDEVLSEIGQLSLLENPEFEVYKGIPTELPENAYLDLKGINKKNRTSLAISICCSEICFYLETGCEWPVLLLDDKHLNNPQERKSYKELIKAILSQPIYIETQKKKRIVRLFNEDGTEAGSLNDYSKFEMHDSSEETKAELKKPFFS